MTANQATQDAIFLLAEMRKDADLRKTIAAAMARLEFEDFADWGTRDPDGLHEYREMIEALVRDEEEFATKPIAEIQAEMLERGEIL